ncbi:WhiB family transcriptional regulator [Streptomyces sp. ME19-01-6]|uniref:WhiB family transcriptional regulator n=1 Tax=Streptomyces sp. ME19-01-6 TaxID=3028686 RepID=UPI0029BD8D8C|nr:WhiB family transcriptional regulator [Streptomyces sp. ME19-01-6]MDX3232923.1 WhiB family transcriptional regulator [Streptomyces sp. ME19-01-6]
MDSLKARALLTEHRHYRYRGCAPVPASVADFPGQALGDPQLHIDAWGTVDRPDDDPEPQKKRIARERTAIAVCEACPVLAACRVYANSETPDGHLAEPDGIWGGQRSLDRHRALIKRRQADTTRPPAAVLAEARTDQKQALLAALARETDEELVAYRAGMDVRTANWHRSLLCGLLGLDKDTASREELLGAARRFGVLPERVRIRPDGRWPIAAAPNGDGSRQRRIAPGMPQQIVISGFQHMPRGRRPSPIPAEALAAARRSPCGPRLRLVVARPEQLPLPLPVAASIVLESAA